MNLSLRRAMKETASQVEEALGLLLPNGEGLEKPLFDAMRHGALSGGKRLRPFLVLTTADMFGVARECSLRTAAAIECLHTYSLIHDDLPAMDDADTRRGKPSVHTLFGEATAILAGDALLTLAFEILAHPDTHGDPAVRCRLIEKLAWAAGGNGMIVGQVLDLAGEKQALDSATLVRMERLKTGKLIGFSCEAGAILGHASDSQRHALRAYANDMGLAFQVVDDLLDWQGDPAQMGKDTGKDAGKSTFVSLQGPEMARKQAEMLIDQAIGHLRGFDSRADLLREVAKFVLERQG
ncbi:MAG: farnesyl-diphosphate synthase [Alphaproteobacteria bacterium GWF2_58_20]|nr:MAG: farnesyl-diphosphate synthase [Alphaproteobacteria bacterium GWF2_58_20]